jgi:AcrR family transcriptional regulator
MPGVNTAGTKGVPRATREAQILDITAEDIGRLGYAGLSVGEVAARVGVSKPLVYGYFGSKDGLYVACVQRAASVLGQAIDEAISGPANLQMAERTLEAILAALQGRPHDWNVLFDRSHPVSGPVADAARQARRRISEQTARGVVELAARGRRLRITSTAISSATCAAIGGYVTSSATSSPHRAGNSKTLRTSPPVSLRR